MADIKLDVPDITVVISEGDQYVSNVETLNEVTVLVQAGEQFLSSIQSPNTITTDGSNYLTVADVAAVSVSSSYAATASYVIFDSSGSFLPAGVVSSSTQIIDYNLFATTGSNTFSATQQITGSLITTEEIKSNEFQLNAGTVSLVFTGSINQGVFGVSEYIQPYISTLQYSGMTVEYLAQRPGACRMGIIMASWLDTGSVTFTDISTTDIGDTSDISFRFISSSNELRLRVNSAGSGSGTWTVQSLFKLFPNLNS
jgi:hypothetical protein